MENIELTVEKKIKNNPVDEMDKRNHSIFKEAIDEFINLLNSQMDSFSIINNTLAMNVKTCANRFKKFINEKGVKIIADEGQRGVTYHVPLEQGSEFERSKDDLSSSIDAYILFPKNTIVAMVSLYDAFVADLL